MTIDDLCGRYRRIGLDANVFVYLFESEGRLAKAAAAVLDAVSDGRLVGVASSISLTEVLVGPVMAGEETMAERYLDAMCSIENLHIVPPNVEIAADAAFVRGRTGLTLADAIHVATARTAGAGALVTNDRRIRPTMHLDVIQLSELATP